MFKINEYLATHGLDWDDGEMIPDDFNVVDVRELLEMDQDLNPPELYLKLIHEAEDYLIIKNKVVICCSGGVSRSNAIAVGVLIDHFKMDYYDALALVEDKVPICQIEDNHIRALKKIFNVGPP